MAEEQKKTEEELQTFCGGIPCGEMIRKMLEAKKSGQPFNCAEMMSRMMQMFCASGKQKENPTQGTKENPVPN
jgi:polyhydroxyalkanoate synthesis regulator protein